MYTKMSLGLVFAGLLLWHKLCDRAEQSCARGKIIYKHKIVVI